MPRKPTRIGQERGRYYVYYYDEERNRTVREGLGTSDPAEAEARFAYWLIHKGRERPIGSTVADILRLYASEHLRHKRTNQSRRLTTIDKFIETMGRIDAENIEHSDLMGYITLRRREGIADPTIRKELYTLKAAYSFAAKRGKTKVVIHCPELPTSPVKEDWLTREQIATLEAYMEETRKDDRLSPLEIYFALGLRTAARYEAIMELEWSKVDFERGLIDYRTEAWLKRSKAEQRKRRVVVPMSAKLRSVLERAYQERTGPFVVPRKVSKDELRYPFRQMEAATGIEVGPHKLRRSYASLAVMAGVDMVSVARVLGDTIQTVEQRYSRFSPNYLQSAVDI